MNITRRIFKNVLSLSAAQFGSRLFTMLVSIYAARILGSTNFGKFTTAYAFAFLFSVFIDLGLVKIIIREIARNRAVAGQYYSAALVLRMLFGVTTFLLIVILAHLFGYPSDTMSAIYILALAMLAQSFESLNVAVFQGIERMELVAIVATISNILYLIVSIPVLIVTRNFIYMALVVLGRNLFALMLGLLLVVREKISGGIVFVGYSFVRELGRLMLPFAMVEIFAAMFTGLDTVILSRFTSAESVGWYGAAMKPIAILLLFPAVFLQALFPLMSRSYHEARNALIVAYEKAIQYLALLALPVAMGVTMLADRFVVLLYGADYAPAAPALRILSWTLVVMFLNSVYGFVLPAIDEQKAQAVYCGVMVCVLVSGAILLIPSWGLGLGYLGAGLALTLSQLAGLSLQSWHVAAKLHAIPWGRLLSRPVLASVIMGGGLWLCRTWPLAVLIPAGAVIYLVALIGLRTFDSTDRKIAGQLLGGYLVSRESN